MKQLFDLFFTFMRIGGLTFGGGYAMLPMLQKEVVENKHWATEEELMDYYAIGQCTPGVIAINTATFIGYKTAGIPGGIFATLGVVFPSWIIITIIALFIRNFAEYPMVRHALSGITVAVFVLVMDAVLKLAKKSVTDAGGALIFGIVLLLSLFTGVSAAWLVLGAGVFGAVIKTLRERKK